MPKNDTNTQEPETKAEVKPVQPDNTGLVKVFKAGESLMVNPTTVEAHKAAGWKVA